MGTCSCTDSNQQDYDLKGAMTKDSLFIAYNIYNKQMIPEIRSLYQQMLGGHSQQIRKIEIIKQDLNGTDIKLLKLLLQHTHRLQELTLKQNSLGSLGMSKLSSNLPPSLKILTVSWNSIQDEGLLALSRHLPHFFQLKKLDISGNVLTRNSMENFCENIEYLTSLKSLQIQDNLLERKGVRILAESLSKLPVLSQFFFDFQYLNEDDFDYLQELLPNVKMHLESYYTN